MISHSHSDEESAILPNEPFCIICLLLEGRRLRSELDILRSIAGDAHSKSIMRREIAQGRVEDWLARHDADVVTEALEEYRRDQELR